MSEKKIATCVKLLVNLGNYSNIEIAKYDERTIEYDSEESRLEQENKQTEELIHALNRDVEYTVTAIGDGLDAKKIENVRESVKKEMPAWLGEDVVPNIANNAKKLQDKSDANKHDKLEDMAEKQAEIDDLVGETTEQLNQNKEEAVTEPGDLFEDDLFE